jgi:hypothetical protein
MTIDDVRNKMMSFRQTADAEASALKDPQLTLDRLRDLYAKFDEDDRQSANQVLSEWVLSDDEGLSFDARDLIREFSVMAAVPALKTLEQKLRSSDKPGARAWSEVVQRLIMDLSRNDTAEDRSVIH